MENAKNSKWFNGLCSTERKLASAIGWICAFWFGLMIIIIMWQVITRFVLKISVPWTDEAARYLWVTIIFLGAGAAVTDNAHIEINIIGSLLRGQKDLKKRYLVSKWDDIIRFIITGGLSAFVLYYFIQVTIKVAFLNQVSQAMQIPTWILYIVIDLGFLTVVIHCIFRIIISIVDHDRILDPIVREEEK